MDLFERQGWFPGLVPHGIDDVQHLRMPDELFFKLMLSRKINEEDAQQHGQEPLPWQYQHGDAREEKNQPQDIFGQEPDASNDGMMIGKPGFVKVILKVVGRESEQNGRDGD